MIEYGLFKERLYFALVQILFFGEKNISPPEGAPDWLRTKLEYYFDEFSNSRQELCALIKDINRAKDFAELYIILNLENRENNVVALDCS